MYKPFTKDEIEKVKNKINSKKIFSAKVEFEKNKENIFKALAEGYKNRFVYTMLKERKEFNYSYASFLRVLKDEQNNITSGE